MGTGEVGAAGSAYQPCLREDRHEGFREVSSRTEAWSLLCRLKSAGPECQAGHLDFVFGRMQGF